MKEFAVTLKVYTDRVARKALLAGPNHMVNTAAGFFPMIGSPMAANLPGSLAQIRWSVPSVENPPDNVFLTFESDLPRERRQLLVVPRDESRQKKLVDMCAQLLSVYANNFRAGASTSTQQGAAPEDHAFDFLSMEQTNGGPPPASGPAGMINAINQLPEAEHRGDLLPSRGKNKSSSSLTALSVRDLKEMSLACGEWVREIDFVRRIGLNTRFTVEISLFNHLQTNLVLLDVSLLATIVRDVDRGHVVGGRETVVSSASVLLFEDAERAILELPKGGGKNMISSTEVLADEESSPIPEAAAAALRPSSSSTSRSTSSPPAPPRGATRVVLLPIKQLAFSAREKKKVTFLCYVLGPDVEGPPGAGQTPGTARISGGFGEEINIGGPPPGGGGSTRNGGDHEDHEEDRRRDLDPRSADHGPPRSAIGGRGHDVSSSSNGAPAPSGRGLGGSFRLCVKGISWKLDPAQDARVVNPLVVRGRHLVGGRKVVPGGGRRGSSAAAQMMNNTPMVLSDHRLALEIRPDLPVVCVRAPDLPRELFGGERRTVVLIIDYCPANVSELHVCVGPPSCTRFADGGPSAVSADVGTIKIVPTSAEAADENCDGGDHESSWPTRSIRLEQLGRPTEKSSFAGRAGVSVSDDPLARHRRSCRLELVVHGVPGSSGAAEVRVAVLAVGFGENSPEKRPRAWFFLRKRIAIPRSLRLNAALCPSYTLGELWLALQVGRQEELSLDHENAFVRLGDGRLLRAVLGQTSSLSNSAVQHLYVLSPNPMFEEAPPPDVLAPSDRAFWPPAAHHVQGSGGDADDMSFFGVWRESKSSAPVGGGAEGGGRGASQEEYFTMLNVGAKNLEKNAGLYAEPRRWGEFQIHGLRLYTPRVQQPIKLQISAPGSARFEPDLVVSDISIRFQNVSVWKNVHVFVSSATTPSSTTAAPGAVQSDFSWVGLDGDLELKLDPLQTYELKLAALFSAPGMYNLNAFRFRGSATASKPFAFPWQKLIRIDGGAVLPANGGSGRGVVGEHQARRGQTA